MREVVVATLSPNTWKLVSTSYLCRAGELTVSIDVVLGAGDSAVNACCLLLDSRASQNSAIDGRFWMIASGLLALYSWLTGSQGMSVMGTNPTIHLSAFYAPPTRGRVNQIMSPLLFLSSLTFPCPPLSIVHLSLSLASIHPRISRSAPDTASPWSLCRQPC
jgi:hypothetical protein